MKWALNVNLQFNGFKGEGIVDHRIWINKTHFPLRCPYDKEYRTNMVIICVRNPIDVFVSEFLQYCTVTHNHGINEPFHTAFPEWDLMITTSIKAFKRWYNYWIDKAESSEVPVLFLRFEDLIKSPNK
jgi:hypothetical protein